MERPPPPRVIIIGLDGADWSLLRPLLAEGALPTLRALVEGGVSATLESVFPTNSMAAWASLMTGVNPGKHGVFDFVRRSDTPFQTLVTNSTRVRFPTVCELLTGAGLSSCTIDMPPFYPPFEVNGVMLGGVGVLGPEYLSYPVEVSQLLQDRAGGYADDVAWMPYHGREAELVEQLIALTENRLRVAETLLDERAFDLFTVVFVTPDRLHHPFWRDLVERRANEPLARRVYAAVDGALACLLDRIDTTQTDVLVVSDHGFKPVRKMVGVNEILASAGLLPARRRKRLAGRALHLGLRLPDRFQRRIFPFLEDAKWGVLRSLLPGTLAYSEIADTVSVNLAGRESTGVVPQREFDDVRAAAAQALVGFRDPQTGEPPIVRAIKREEYFHGPFAEEAPDLVLEFREGYAYSGILGSKLWSWRWLQGAHRRDGIIACLGPHFRRSAEAGTVSILDVTPTVLGLLEVAAPAEIDGRIAGELLAAPLPAPKLTPVVAERKTGFRQSYSEEEEALIKDRLRGLGYID